MPSDSGVWKKIRKKVKNLFCEKKHDECSKEKRKMVRHALSEKDDDLDQRIHRLQKALKAGHITKKQFRMAKKLIVASYE
jgi:hypothetical protein